MRLFNKVSTKEKEEDKLRAKHAEVAKELDDTFEHLFAAMDEALHHLHCECHENDHDQNE